MSGMEDVEKSRRRYQAPYTPRHKIPTIQTYQKEKEEREAKARAGDDADGAAAGEEAEQSRIERLKDYWYGSENAEQTGGDVNGRGEEQRDHGEQEEDDQDDGGMPDSSQIDRTSDPKQSRKMMRKRKDERARREVTDPVTHLPATIHDFTAEALEEVPTNEPPPGANDRSATGVSNKNKPSKQLQSEHTELEQASESMRAMFPPPAYTDFKHEIADIHETGLTAGLAGMAVVFLSSLVAQRVLTSKILSHSDSGDSTLMVIALWSVIAAVSVAAIWALITGVRQWVQNSVEAIWEDEVWECHRESEEQKARANETESVTWLNSLLSSVWPLVNPDLFTSLADTLEDVMQASLPSMVRMVDVSDVGQGSEAIRILGVRWLPTGAAARSVGADGKLEKKKAQNSDRNVPGEGEVDRSAGMKDPRDEKDQQDKSEDDRNQVSEGMEAEEGDFVNLELGFAYRARPSLKSFAERAKRLHLYIAFYLPGNLKFPVWVDLRGVVGTVRLRLQLTSDPPFFALCTLTFLGQPKVDLSCTPLIKAGLNIMNLPIINNFVQSSIDAAMAEYVAPRSLTLDLKQVLAGADFKKDTSARGVMVVRIKRGYNFKTGDPGIPLLKDGSADPYVSVGWAKFGKPLWSTQVLEKEMEPRWEETAYLLVTPEELNVDERLRIQLWDSDRLTADDDLGRIELDLKQIMRNPESNGKMQQRNDGFRALKAGEDMPGHLEWAVGYYRKTRIQKCQLEQQSAEPGIHSMEELEQAIKYRCERKLREAAINEGRASKDQGELEQQKQRTKKGIEDAMIISAPPPEDYPSGIFSLTIHQITGLEFEKLSKIDADKEDVDYDEDEVGRKQLPDAYCTVIINHDKVFRTRTKPKNSKPFYNAGLERFVPDWRNCEVFVGVRDSRIKEDDPLLGIVHLSLDDLFKDRSQINQYYPLMGGVGYGRVRLSMVWRSVELQAPLNDLGWNFGTLEIQSGPTSSDLDAELRTCKIRFHSDLSYAKMYPSKEGGGKWESKRHHSLRLPFRKRYASSLCLEFLEGGVTRGKTAGFAVFWPSDLVDEEEQEVTLDVCKGDMNRAKTNRLEGADVEKVGTIKLKMTFWSGLGEAHSKWARKDESMREVVQVLQMARDYDEVNQKEKQAGIVEEDGDGDSESEGSDSSDEEESAVVNGEAKDGHPNGEGEEESKSKEDIIHSLQEHRKQRHQRHRRHRGIMQWRLPRTAEHTLHRAEHAMAKTKDAFKQKGKEPGIETEV